MTDKLKSPEKYLLSECKRNAKRRGLEFKLKLSDIKIPEVCPVFGIPLTFEGHKDSTPSIDRVRSDLGYIPKNVVIVSWRCNRLKSDSMPWECFSIWKFFSWLELERGL